MRWMYRVLPILLTMAACHADAGEGAQQANAVGGSLQGPGADVVLRRVWAGDDVDLLGGPSPDGRYVSFVDWETGDLAIRDLVTGTSRRVTNKGTWEESEDFAEFSAISPDGQSIAYAWFTDDAYELRVVGVDGSNPRTVFRKYGEVVWVWPYGWTPDSQEILAALSYRDVAGGKPGYVNHLALVPLDGSPPVDLKSFGPRLPEKAAVSPDGKWVAFDEAVGEDSGVRDLFVMPVDGDTRTRITEEAGAEVLIGWDLAGEYLWYYKSQGKDDLDSVWRIQMRAGKAAGRPELIRSDIWGFKARGASNRGIAYGVDVEKPVRFLGAMDAEAGRIVMQPIRISPLQRTPEAGAAWSRDGAYFAYSLRGDALAGRPWVIILRSSSTGSEREIEVPLTFVWHLEWAPDNETLYLVGNAGDQGGGIFRLDLRTNQTTRIEGTSDVAVQPRAAVSPDGTTLYYVGLPLAYDGPQRLIARNLESGETRVVLEVPRVGQLAISPDGRSLAAVLHDFKAGTKELVIQDLVEPASRRVLLASPGSTSYSRCLYFTPDGEILRFASRNLDSSEPETFLYEIPTSGGEARKIVALPSIRVAVHPDGRQFTYVEGPTKSELWVMENLPGFQKN